MFANKVVIVTGGSSGIGAATAENFAKEGAAVAIVGRNEDKLLSVQHRCRMQGAEVLIIKADVSKDDEVNTIIEQTVGQFGKIDILVNNAGIVRTAGVDESNAMATYDEVMNTNLRSVVQLTNLVAPHLKETKGNIVNVSSYATNKIPFPALSAYVMSKIAMDHFTKASAIELAAHGVRVNCINPGLVETEIFETFDLSRYMGGRQITPDNSSLMGRMADAVEIADLILYMASDKARSITGSCYVIDNGALLM